MIRSSKNMLPGKNRFRLNLRGGHIQACERARTAPQISTFVEKCMLADDACPAARMAA